MNSFLGQPVVEEEGETLPTVLFDAPTYTGFNPRILGGGSVEEPGFSSWLLKGQEEKEGLTVLESADDAEALGLEGPFFRSKVEGQNEFVSVVKGDAGGEMEKGEWAAQRAMQSGVSLSPMLRLPLHSLLILAYFADLIRAWCHRLPHQLTLQLSCRACRDVHVLLLPRGVAAPIPLASPARVLFQVSSLSLSLLLSHSNSSLATITGDWRTIESGFISFFRTIRCINLMSSSEPRPSIKYVHSLLHSHPVLTSHLSPVRESQARSSAELRPFDLVQALLTAPHVAHR